MDKSEKLALGLSGLLLVIFLGAIVYAGTAKNIEVPTCITDMEPFATDTLFQSGRIHTSCRWFRVCGLFSLQRYGYRLVQL